MRYRPYIIKSRDIFLALMEPLIQILSGRLHLDVLARTKHPLHMWGSERRALNDRTWWLQVTQCNTNNTSSERAGQ